MRVVRRDNAAKTDIPVVDLVEQVKAMLDNIQQNLFDIAKQKRDACIKTVRTWDEFIEALGQKKMILAPWCDEMVWKLTSNVLVDAYYFRNHQFFYSHAACNFFRMIQNVNSFFLYQVPKSWL